MAEIVSSNRGQDRGAGPDGLVRRNGSSLFVVGEIDVSNATVLGQELTMCLAEGATDIVVDMTGLTFIDCAAVSTLAQAISQLDPGGSLVVRNPPRSARIIFEVTGLNQSIVIDVTERATG